MTIAIEGVSVRLGRDPDDFRRYAITVQVYSRKRPGLKASNDVDPGRSDNFHTLVQKVGTAAAACAEYLGERYGDNIDPGLASRNAIRAFGEEVRLLAALNKDAGEKVKRLEALAGLLRSEEQELLHKLHWTLDHGGRLTPVEIEWVNKRIGELHNKQL